MLSFILKRVLATVPVMGVVALIVFLLLRLSPGDPAAVIAGDYATAEQIEKIRTQLGLNQPILVQFISWLGDLARGDLGVSIFSNLPVSTLIAQRIEPTLMLALTTIVFSVARRGAARRARGLEGAQLDRPRRDGVRGGRLLDAGVRARLFPDLRLRARPALVPGAGLSQPVRRSRRCSSATSRCRPSRSRRSSSR